MYEITKASSKMHQSSKTFPSTQMTDPYPISTGFWPGCLAPDFTDVPCVRAGLTSSFNLQTLQGKNVLLVFYPMDFDYLVSSEMELLHQLRAECEVVAISTGSILGKQSFINTPKYVTHSPPSLTAPPHPNVDPYCHRREGGVLGVDLTLVEDRCGHIARAYGVLGEGPGTGGLGSGYWSGVIPSFSSFSLSPNIFSYRAMFLLDVRGEIVAR